MEESAWSDGSAARQLTGLQVMERVAQALEDRFEAGVRAALVAGLALPVERLRDYLTGVGDAHEPRVRLLFELYDLGALDLSGPLADVPQTCFFRGAAARHHVPLDAWLDLFGPPRALERRRSDPPIADLWSAGDLVWGRQRLPAERTAAFLTIALDQPVGLWHARVPAATLRVVAEDQRSVRQSARVVVPPGSFEARQVSPGIVVPTDRCLIPKPRVVTEP